MKQEIAMKRDNPVGVGVTALTSTLGAAKCRACRRQRQLGMRAAIPQRPI